MASRQVAPLTSPIAAPSVQSRVDTPGTATVASSCCSNQAGLQFGRVDGESNMPLTPQSVCLPRWTVLEAMQARQELDRTDCPAHVDPRHGVTLAQANEEVDNAYTMHRIRVGSLDFPVDGFGCAMLIDGTNCALQATVGGTSDHLLDQEQDKMLSARTLAVASFEEASPCRGG